MKKVFAILFFAGALVVGLNFVNPTLPVKSAYAVNENSFANPVFIKLKSIVRVQFVRVNNVKKVSYVSTYTYNNIPQGVSGSFNPNGKNTVQKDIFLGTCSQNVCIKHFSASNIQLEVTFEYKNGSQITKTYNVKN